YPPDQQGAGRSQDGRDAAPSAAAKARQPPVRRRVRPGQPAGARRDPLQDEPRHRRRRRRGRQARPDDRQGRRSDGQTLKDLVSAEDLEVDLADGAPAAADEEANPDVEDAPVVKYIQKILLDAIGAGVSDIHFEPYEKYYRIRYRLDGILKEVAQPPLAIKDKMASRIKVISRLDISEKRVPQDGRMKLSLSKSRAIDFRVSTLPTLYGEKIVLRILDAAGVKLGIEALGYEPDQQQIILDAIKRPYGMILVTGPTGSGKTVSLYTC